MPKTCLWSKISENQSRIGSSLDLFILLQTRSMRLKMAINYYRDKVLKKGSCASKNISAPVAFSMFLLSHQNLAFQ